MRKTPEHTGVFGCYCLPRSADVTAVLPFIHYKPSSMRIISFVIALLMCCNVLQAQNRKAESAEKAKTVFRPFTKQQQQERLDKDLYGRMSMRPDVKTKVSLIMSDFLTQVEQQTANPNTLTKSLMAKTLADRNKRLKAVLGEKGLQKFVDFERQMPPPQPDPKSFIQKQPR
jgi:hypothetical protein